MDNKQSRAAMQMTVILLFHNAIFGRLLPTFDVACNSMLLLLHAATKATFMNTFTSSILKAPLYV